MIKIATQKNNSMLLGIKNAVAMPIAKPNKESLNKSCQFIDQDLGIENVHVKFN